MTTSMVVIHFLVMVVQCMFLVMIMCVPFWINFCWLRLQGRFVPRQAWWFWGGRRGRLFGHAISLAKKIFFGWLSGRVSRLFFFGDGGGFAGGEQTSL